MGELLFGCPLSLARKELGERMTYMLPLWARMKSDKIASTCQENSPI